MHLGAVAQVEPDLEGELLELSHHGESFTVQTDSPVTKETPSIADAAATGGP